MSVYKESKITKIFKKKKVWALIFIIMLCLSGTIGVITYYGQQVGSFVVGVSDEAFEGGLALSESNTFEVSGPRLVGDAISDVHPVSLLDIYSEKVLSTNGTYTSNSGNYIGYTFYLKNEGTMSVNVDMTMTISKATHYLDRACWVWIFEGDEDKTGTVYKKEDTVSHNYGNYQDYELKEFVDDEVVMKSNIVFFKPNEVKKYSVIMWLEGEDPDCTDVGEYSVISGLIRFSIRFDIVSEDAYDKQEGLV